MPHSGEKLVEQVREELGLKLEEKSTARGCLLVVQSAIIPAGSSIQHDPASKIRCGDVLCRVDGQDVRFMNFADAGRLLLTGKEDRVVLGFVSAVQRGYDVVVLPSRASTTSQPLSELSLDVERLDAELPQRLDANTSSQAANSSLTAMSADSSAASESYSEEGKEQLQCVVQIASPPSDATKSTASTETSSPQKSASNGSDHGVEKLDTDCQGTQSGSPRTVADKLRWFYVHYAPSKTLQVDAILAAHPEYQANPTTLNKVLQQRYGADLGSLESMDQNEHMHMYTCGAQQGERQLEQQSLIKRLLDQNQTLIDSLQEVREKLNASQARADSLGEEARHAERRAKAAEARLAVIKSELGSLKEQGKLAEPATKIHESMLTPKHDKRYIPQQPLLQNRAALAAPYPHTQRVQRVAVSPNASFAGSQREVPRTANFAYMNCLGAYPRSSADGLEICEDPLLFCPQPEAETKTTTQPAPPLLSSSGETSMPSLMTGFISQGDMLEARLLGLSQSQMTAQCRKGDPVQQLQIANATFMGGHPSGQIAIAFVNDFPTWTGGQKASTPRSVASVDLSSNVSRELSASPRWTPTENVGTSSSFTHLTSLKGRPPSPSTRSHAHASGGAAPHVMVLGSDRNSDNDMIKVYLWRNVKT